MPTADILDARIRSLVTELIEAAPPAPLLPQLEWGLSDRWGRDPDTLERRPVLDAPQAPRRPGRLRVLVSTVVVLGALAAVATLVAVGPRSAPPTPLGQTHPRRPSDQPPAAVSGNEQTIRPVSVPAFFQPGQSSVPPDCWVGAGHVLAFSVAGSPPLVAWARPGDAATTVTCPSGPTPPVTYAGSGLDDGRGRTLDPVTAPLAGSPTSVFVLAGWPVAGTTVSVWSALPADVAYVTYSVPGSTSYWEEPDGGVAAFLVPRLYPGDGGLHAPVITASPILRAYDADGTLIGTVHAPA